MSNQGIKNNGVKGTGTAGRHQATDQTKERMKWEKGSKQDCNLVLDKE